ncbi:MAG: hypothetical protein IJA44_03665 [Clostridia bacterium]|nr:hypothetical protein [Clostridia bacterium]
MIFIFLLLAVSTFLIGFLCGYKKEKKPIVRNIEHNDYDLLMLQKEYENFLNYDGTEQQ